jgi:hypothetical protein
MAILKSKYSSGIIGVPYPDCSGVVVGFRFSHQLAANPQIGDILELGLIPVGCRVIDITFDSDDLDTNAAPTVAFDVGIMSGTVGSDDNARTCGQEFAAALNIGQAGGVVRMSKLTGFRTGVQANEVGIGLKWTARSATFAAGTIGMTVLLATE